MQFCLKSGDCWADYLPIFKTVGSIPFILPAPTPLCVSFAVLQQVNWDSACDFCTNLCWPMGL